MGDAERASAGARDSSALNLIPDAETASVVDSIVESTEAVTLPVCGLCAERRPCANCQDNYGRDGGCGLPICRRCRDDGPPADAPGPPWGALMAGFDPMTSVMTALGMYPADFDPFAEDEDDD